MLTIWKNGYWIYIADVDADEDLSKRKKDFQVDQEIIKSKSPIYQPK